MRLLFIVTLAVALGWSGYWFVGARAKEAAVTRVLAEVDAGPLRLSHGAIAVGGFPNRFDTRINAPAIADPAGGWGWTGPWLQILALSYTPNHVIAIAPPESRLTLPGGATLDIAADNLRGSVRVAPRPSLPLAQLVAEATALRLDGGRAALAEGLFALRPDPGRGAPAYDLALTLKALSLPEAVMQRLGGADLPRAISRLELRLAPVFDRPLDRHAATGAPLRLTALGIQTARLQWGDLGLAVSGDLAADAEGFAAGEVTLEVADWRTLVAVLRASGRVPPAAMRMLEGGLRQAAAGGDRVRLPLQLSGGRVRMGFVPLMAAPRLHGGDAPA